MVSKVSNFNWDKIIKKMDFADAQRSLQLLRGKFNEIEVINIVIDYSPFILYLLTYYYCIKRHYLQSMLLNQPRLILNHIKRN